MSVDVKYPWPPPRLDQWCAEVDADPTPSYLLEDILPTDAAVILSGRAKESMKTWLVFLACQALAAGKTCSGFKPVDVKGCGVLILEFEGARKLTRRRWGWLVNGYGLREDQDWVKNIHFAHRYPVMINNPDWRARLADYVVAHDIRLVVIDTLAKANDGDENSVADVSEAMRAIDVIRSASKGRTSVMFLHHLRKDRFGKETQNVTDDIDDDLRGSSALTGFYDVHWAIRMRRGGLVLTVRQKDDGETYYRLAWDIKPLMQTATLSMTKFDPDAEVKTDDCLQRLDRLREGQQYSFLELCETWDQPGEVVKATIAKLEGAALIEKAARGWRKTK